MRDQLRQCGHPTPLPVNWWSREAEFHSTSGKAASLWRLMKCPAYWELHAISLHPHSGLGGRCCYYLSPTRWGNWGDRGLDRWQNLLTTQGCFIITSSLRRSSFSYHSFVKFSYHREPAYLISTRCTPVLYTYKDFFFFAWIKDQFLPPTRTCALCLNRS